MLSRVWILAFGLFLLSNARAAEPAYHRSVSDIEVEESIKGCTYNKGPTRATFFNNWSFGGSKKDCCCESPVATTTTTQSSAPVVTTTTTTTTTTTAGNTPRIKYILDGKPVYEDGKKGESGAPGVEGTPAEKPKAAEAPKAAEEAAAPAVSEGQIKTAISRLSTSAWRDAQSTLVAAGKAAVPHLIEALSNSGEAYSVGGHTKSDSSRAPRTRTIGEVCAELLMNIVQNHSNYSGETPALDQAAWREWWNKNGATVQFAGI